MKSRDALRFSLLALAAALPVSIAGMNIGLGLVTGALLWHRLSGNALDWRAAKGPAAACLWLYAAAAALAALAGVAPADSLGALAKDLHKLWVFYALLLAFRAAQDGEERGLGLGFALIAAVGVGQALTLRAADGQSWIRAHGFVHPVTFGAQMGWAVLGGLCFLARGRPGWRHGAFLALAAGALVLSQTRGAFLGVCAGFAALGACDAAFRRRLKWAALAALAGVILLELLPTHRSLIASLAEHGFTASGQLERLSLWKVALQVFRDHPWTGVGPGNYKTVFDSYFVGEIARQKVWGSAHNLYLHQAAERGLLGLTALLCLFAALLLGAWKRVKAEADAWNLWALAGTAAFVVMSLTETAFQNEMLATLLLFVWTRAEAGRARNSYNSA